MYLKKNYLYLEKYNISKFFKHLLIFDIIIRNNIIYFISFKKNFFKLYWKNIGILA